MRIDVHAHLVPTALPRPPSSSAGNFYFDSPPFDPLAIRHLVHRFGSRRVLVGSDYPFAIREVPPGKHMREVVGLSQDQQSDLGFRTCLEFLGLPPG